MVRGREILLPSLVVTSVSSDRRSKIFEAALRRIKRSELTDFECVFFIALVIFSNTLDDKSFTHSRACFNRNWNFMTFLFVFFIFELSINFKSSCFTCCNDERSSIMKNSSSFHCPFLAFFVGGFRDLTRILTNFSVAALDIFLLGGLRQESRASCSYFSSPSTLTGDVVDIHDRFHGTFVGFVVSLSSSTAGEYIIFCKKTIETY